MSVLKAPPKQPKNATLQVRIDEDLKYKVEKYAEFLETTGAYVVSEALRLVFNKDAEFKSWLEERPSNNEPPKNENGSLFEAATRRNATEGGRHHAAEIAATAGRGAN